MINQIIIIGGNVFKEDGPILNFIEICKKYKIKTFLITDKSHLKYPTKNNNSLKSELNKRKIEYKCFKKFDENTLKFITKLKNKNSIVISLNSIWIFNKKTISKLKTIYNYHNIDLPRFRGAACHSWRIMMGGEMKTFLNIHLVSKKIDQGDILLRKKIKIPKHCLNLSSFYDYLIPHETNFFEDFIKKLNKKKFRLIKQNNLDSFYWPALKTHINGFVDWNWTSKEIVSFCHAFDAPFIGISTFLNNKKIYLINAKISDKKKFHPFQIGLIYRKVKSRIFVATSNGGVSFNFANPKKIKFKLGDRLHTDPKSILISKGIN